MFLFRKILQMGHGECLNSSMFSPFQVNNKAFLPDGSIHVALYWVLKSGIRPRREASL